MGKAERTREHLVAVATRAFAERGLAATTVRDITQQAGVSNGTFYYHFHDKDDLLDAVGVCLVRTVIAELHAEMDHLPTPEERVAHGVQWIIARAVADRELGALLADLFQDHATDPELTARFEADLAAGLEQGSFDTPWSPLLARFFAAVTAAGIRAALDEMPDAAPCAAGVHLRMLGVPGGRADDLARGR